MLQDDKSLIIPYYQTDLEGKSVVVGLGGSGMIEEFKDGELAGLLTGTGLKDLPFVFEVKTGQQLDLVFVMGAA